MQLGPGKAAETGANWLPSSLQPWKVNWEKEIEQTCKRKKGLQEEEDQGPVSLWLSELECVPGMLGLQAESLLPPGSPAWVEP